MYQAQKPCPPQVSNERNQHYHHAGHCGSDTNLSTPFTRVSGLFRIQRRFWQNHGGFDRGSHFVPFIFACTAGRAWQTDM